MWSRLTKYLEFYFGKFNESRVGIYINLQEYSCYDSEWNCKFWYEQWTIVFSL